MFINRTTLAMSLGLSFLALAGCANTSSMSGDVYRSQLPSPEGRSL